MADGVQAGDELDIPEAQVFQAPVCLFGMTGAVPGDHAQGIVVHGVLIQKDFGGEHPLPGAVSLRIHPVGLMSLPEAIHRKAHQEALRFQKLCPILIEQRAVGLNGKADPHFGWAVLLYFFRKMPEIRKTGHGGLPALKGKADCTIGVHRLKNLPDQLVRQFFLHNTHAALCSVLGFILIKAVFTPEITQTGSRFDQQIYIFHLEILLPALFSAPKNCYLEGRCGNTPWLSL